MIIIARMTHEGKEYIGKRDVQMYEGTDAKTKHANVGLTLEVQRQIREALAVKNGLRKASVAGKVVDYSDIPEL